MPFFYIRNVIELFKQKHQHEWKKKSKTNLDEVAKKKWDSLSSSQKKEYIEELKRINEEYLDTFGRFLQVSYSAVYAHLFNFCDW